MRRPTRFIWISHKCSNKVELKQHRCVAECGVRSEHVHRAAEVDSRNVATSARRTADSSARICGRQAGKFDHLGTHPGGREDVRWSVYGPGHRGKLHHAMTVVRIQIHNPKHVTQKVQRVRRGIILAARPHGETCSYLLAEMKRLSSTGIDAVSHNA